MIVILEVVEMLDCGVLSPTAYEVGLNYQRLLPRIVGRKLDGPARVTAAGITHFGS